MIIKSIIEYRTRINDIQFQMFLNWHIDTLAHWHIMIKEVDDFVDFLRAKQKSKNRIKERKFGCAKNLMVMHDDFDAPLDDIKEYM